MNVMVVCGINYNLFIVMSESEYKLFVIYMSLCLKHKNVNCNHCNNFSVLGKYIALQKIDDLDILPVQSLFHQVYSKIDLDFIFIYY